MGFHDGETGHPMRFQRAATENGTVTVRRGTLELPAHGCTSSGATKLAAWPGQGHQPENCRGLGRAPQPCRRTELGCRAAGLLGQGWVAGEDVQSGGRKAPG